MKNSVITRSLIGVLAFIGGLTVLAVLVNIVPLGFRSNFGHSPEASPWDAALYEEDSNNPNGRRYPGSATWRNEMVSPGPGLAPELAVRADIKIPQRRMTVTLSLRHNTDNAIPGVYAIEIIFDVPVDFPGGGIANVPGILMKEAEQSLGSPLPETPVRMANGSFRIGLARGDVDLQLLKNTPWFDIPIFYANGNRAIITMAKGPSGDRAFADAFTVWQK
jgi:hypothetical protein